MVRSCALITKFLLVKREVGCRKKTGERLKELLIKPECLQHSQFSIMFAE